MVEGDIGGNGGDQAQGGSEQGLGDAGRHDGQVGVLLDRDGLEAVHDPPHGTEQADEGRSRGDDGQGRKPSLDPQGLTGDGGVEDPVDPLDQEGRLSFRDRTAPAHLAPAVVVRAAGKTDGCAATLYRSVADEGAISPFESAAAALEKRALVQQLRRLEEREEEVLRARFGIDDHPMTLSEIGEKLGITRERVRQIESRALGKLRHPSVSRVWHEGQRSADAV